MPERLPCISLWQPWAALLAGGKKRIETRHWAPRLDLPCRLAIHAARRYDADQRALCGREPFRSALADLGDDWPPGGLPRGCVIGVVTLVRWYQFGPHTPPPAEPERSFGDFAPGRYGWVCEDARLLARPIPTRGYQQIWYLPPMEYAFAGPAAGGAESVPVPPAATLFGL